MAVAAIVAMTVPECALEHFEVVPDPAGGVAELQSVVVETAGVGLEFAVVEVTTIVECSVVYSRTISASAPVGVG